MKNDDDANNPKSRERPVSSDTASSASGQRYASISLDTTSRYNAPTVSALIKGLHQTGTRDMHTLHLPLFHTDDEEEDDEEDDHSGKSKSHDSKSKPLTTNNTPQTRKSSLLNLHLHHNSPNSLLTFSPAHKHSASELSPHSSLPRLIVNIDPAGDNNNGDNGHKTPDTDIPTSPGRRFSQFNFHLRRFSHAHNATVLEFFLSIFFAWAPLPTIRCLANFYLAHFVTLDFGMQIFSLFLQVLDMILFFIWSGMI